MYFFSTLLSGIVVGLAAMITAILNNLSLAELGGVEFFGGISVSTLLEMFNVANTIPPYYLQIAIGIYLVQIIFILTGTLVSINSGEDKLERLNKSGKNLRKGIFLYFIVALLAAIMLFVLSSVVLGGVLG